MCCVGSEHGCGAIDGVFASDAAAGAGSSGEDQRVGAGDRGGDVVDGRVLEVQQHAIGPILLDVGEMLLPADERPHGVSACMVQSRENPGYLPMATGDHHVHGAGPYRRPCPRG